MREEDFKALTKPTNHPGWTQLIRHFLLPQIKEEFPAYDWRTQYIPGTGYHNVFGWPVDGKGKHKRDCKGVRSGVNTDNINTVEEAIDALDRCRLTIREFISTWDGKS